MFDSYGYFPIIKFPYNNRINELLILINYIPFLYSIFKSLIIFTKKSKKIFYLIAKKFTWNIIIRYFIQKTSLSFLSQFHFYLSFSRHFINACNSALPWEVLHSSTNRTFTWVPYPSQENYQRIKNVQFWLVFLSGLDLRFPVFCLFICMAVQSARSKTIQDSRSELHTSQVQERQILFLWRLTNHQPRSLEHKEDLPFILYI